MRTVLKKIIKFSPFVFMLLLGLTPVIWFIGKGNVLINGIDTNFPLNPLIWFTRRFYVWNNILNGGVDYSSSTAGIFFHFVQTLPSLLGLRLQAVEIASLLFWFMLIVFSSYLFAKTIFPKRPLAQLLFVVFYSFNIYLFNTWENVKVANLSLVAGIPLALTIFTLMNKGLLSRKSAFLFALLTGLVVSGTGINPSYFIALLLVIVIFYFGCLIAFHKLRLRVSYNFVLVILAIILMNSYWIFPTVYYVLKDVPFEGSIDKLGFTNWIDSLSENTSIFNVLRLQGAWDWYTVDLVSGSPLYIPYALNYFYRLPFIVFSLVAPALSMLALIFRRKGNGHLYSSFSILLVVGVFLGVGTHEPTGQLFRFLINRLPFFSLFRSPWYIFTPLLILAYAGLVGLLFDTLIDYTQDRKLKIGGVLLGFLGAVLIVGNLVYCYPLITGKIFRPNRSDGFYVHIPTYVFDASRWLAKTGNDGRIISYPDDEVENFRWGYRGIESILQLVSNREIIYSSFNVSGSPISLLIKEFYWNLKRKEWTSAQKIANKLSALMLFEKRDQGSLAPDLSKLLDQNVKFDDFGSWRFYHLSSSEMLPKLSIASNFVYAYPYEKTPVVLSVLDGETQVVNPSDNVVNQTILQSMVLGRVLVAKNIQAEDFKLFINSPSKSTNRIVSRDLSKAVFEFDVPAEGDYEPLLEKYRLTDFGINPQENLRVLLNTKKIVLEVDRTDDSYIYYQPIFLKEGHYRMVLDLINENLVAGGDFEKGQTFARGGLEAEKAKYEIVNGDLGKYLLMTNHQQTDISADFRIKDFNPYLPYCIEIKYKQTYGNYAQIVPEQNTQTTLVKAQKETLPNYPEWGTYSFYYDPVKTESEMKVFLMAPYTTDSLGTKISYDDLTVRKVFTNHFILISRKSTDKNVPEIKYQKKSPVLYEGSVDKARDPHVLVFSENYSPDWEVKIFNANKKVVPFEPKHFSVNYYANGWFLDNMPEKYYFKILYKPQRYYYYGIGVSSTVLLVSIGIILYRKLKKA